ncbi:Fe-S cluster assembly protein HesB [Microbacterium bovistercoris]|uniref:Fe-S cluster assembly protein HesB n=1 Tax=Microbacterium bovistercoris TaxID=2293570 RepID=A0A371NYK3_9MICO|nr:MULTISPECIES: Fe-S cluster assembly protein HesB [Microbacterium]MVQ41938.1 Fe-S cluster assembly protein HesB [Microbacterium sp. MAH-37]REJ07674.1 Fe-S cluster assembly protein HesB [Microbacterium bovistercoris]
MLTLTENASTIVTTLVTRQTTDPGAGLRIHPTESGTTEEPRFMVSVAPAPEPGDDIVDSEGTRVFLEHEASEALTDKVLDAGVDEQGAVSFTLLPQPA